MSSTTGSASAATGGERLLPRREPLQRRSVERAQRILDVTAALLDDVGFDALTTILIARAAGISVGTLYHYFPNKHAIMCALAERWLREVEASLDEIERWRLDALPLAEFVERVVERQLAVYRAQQGILHLVQAMFSVPELRGLDQRHDELVIARMTAAFARLGLRGTANELGRIARAWLELTHALLLVVVNQNGVRARRTLADLKRLALCLLQPYQDDGEES
ncbi:MAG: hypothetical protein CALGDGBN_01830 [Pseudomonadales bacterium]|nr:hypothetical protein [Pseudomonadales bacterium]